MIKSFHLLRQAEQTVLKQNGFPRKIRSILVYSDEDTIIAIKKPHFRKSFCLHFFSQVDRPVLKYANYCFVFEWWEQKNAK